MVVAGVNALKLNVAKVEVVDGCTNPGATPKMIEALPVVLSMQAVETNTLLQNIGSMVEKLDDLLMESNVTAFLLYVMCTSTALTSFAGNELLSCIFITEYKVDVCEGETFFELGLKLKALFGV